jgi:hypothetical protein
MFNFQLKRLFKIITTAVILLIHFFIVSLVLIFMIVFFFIYLEQTFLINDLVYCLEGNIFFSG